MSEPDHDFQILIWGYSILGDAVDHVALIAEQGHVWDYPVWDRTASDLDGSLRSIDGGDYERVPDFWALPWVTESLLRRGIGWRAA